nr:CCR4-NOT transcription complex subunit 1-like isoform [Cryptomonas curvata]
MNYMDNINFIFNKLCEKKLSIKIKDAFKNYKSTDIIKIAYYLVSKRVCIEPSFHKIYKKFINNVSCCFPKFNYIVFRASVEILFLILYKNTKYISFPELRIIKYLGSWIGRITIRLNKAPLNNYFTFEKLLVRAYDMGFLFILIPFISGFLHFLPKSKIFCVDNIWTMRPLIVLREILDLVNLKSYPKLDLKSFFKFIEFDKKLYLNLNKKIRKDQKINFQSIRSNFKIECFFFNKLQFKNVLQTKNYFILFSDLKKTKLLNCSGSNVYKILDIKNYIPGDSHEKISIIIGIFKKFYLFSEKNFSFKINYNSESECCFKRNISNFKLTEIYSIEYAFKLNIICVHFVFCSFLNNLLTDDIKLSSNLIWLLKNRRYICSYISFNYKRIETLKKKFLYIFIYFRLEYFNNKIDCFKKEKLDNYVNIYSEKIEENTKINNFIQNHFKYTPVENKLSKIFFINYSIRTSNKYCTYRTFIKRKFFIYLPIFKRELSIVLLLSQYYCLCVKMNQIFKRKILNNFSSKLIYLKIKEIFLPVVHIFQKYTIVS